MPAEDSRRRVNRTLGPQTHLNCSGQAQELAGRTRPAIGGTGTGQNWELVIGRSEVDAGTNSYTLQGAGGSGVRKSQVWQGERPLWVWLVRFEVEEVGGGSGVASVVDQEVSDTAPNLQVSIGIPLRNSTHTPARSPPVVENGAPNKRLTGGVEGLKRLGIGWCWARGEAGRGYDWVKIIFALGGYFAF